ncbi:16S rRNA (guanine1207-N2)-methyltransferase [Oceanospirillum multiglobuliferum]|uniref:Ribosomal RNA large subunit methyltransferase G n=1 Tax=Oceanospirillum multiglobuliferum TaxID=64969 RepID=A0A1T4MKF8_9GAMM|nr:methyltransferase [Oceanospirillum multiglobuliferum]OPX56993.1 50S rRNA methyltransferase [Oceanospirillum multiglobuliferum]SJZ67351.1 16S rRNA (guanine1207-N2)-methyltransferase [Oceanospirillum multiglobuliferum]
MEQLNVPQGRFSLARYPIRKNDLLRAWDAADEYLLNHIHEQQLCKPSMNILILNDSFGALTTALAGYQPWSLSDSYLAQEGAKANLERNKIDAKPIKLCSSLEYPTEQMDLVVMKVPKSLSMLEEQLHRIRPLLKSDTVIIAAAMAKLIHTSTLNHFERLIGETKTSLAVKKARLIFAAPNLTLSVGENPYPLTLALENTAYQLCNHANVFSRERLDIGTRFFLQHLPRNNAQHIVDLGCGNGVVGLIAAERNPEAYISFVDESFMAVDSAKTNFEKAFPERRACFLATDCLAGVEPNSADLILNNPPFHQNNTVGDFIAQQMFREAKNVLKTGGELWVIGNRHLGYHVSLRKLLGNCEMVASNQKFVILRSIKY